MSSIVPYVVLLLYFGAVLAATIVFVRRIWAGWRAGEALPYEAVEDPFKPDPVVRTGGVRAVAALAVAWGGAHLLATVVWLAAGLNLPRTIATIGLSVYALAGAGLSVVGGVLLAMGVANGRRVLAWGQFLLGVAGLLGAVLMILAWQYPKSPERVREVGIYWSLGLVVYVAAAAALGAAGRRVGLPPEARARRARQWPAMPR